MKETGEVKIINRLFLDYWRSPKLKSGSIDEIYNNIEKLGSLREKRLKYKSKAYEYPYYNMLQAVETYHNANYFKFYELYRSVISSINIQSYSSALLSGRAILEHYAMLVYIGGKLDKLLKDKKYFEFTSQLNLLTIPPIQRKFLKKYKRIHVNDALKIMGESFATEKSKAKKKKNAETILKVYNDISEFIHPASPSFIMYEKQSLEQKKDDLSPLESEWVLSSAFSYNSEHTQTTVFQYLKLLLSWSDLLLESLELFNKSIISRLKDEKEKIILKYKNNPLEIQEKIEEHYNVSANQRKKSK